MGTFGGNHFSVNLHFLSRIRAFYSITFFQVHHYPSHIPVIASFHFLRCVRCQCLPAAVSIGKFTISYHQPVVFTRSIVTLHLSPKSYIKLTEFFYSTVISPHSVKLIAVPESPEKKHHKKKCSCTPLQSFTFKSVENDSAEKNSRGYSETDPRFRCRYTHSKYEHHRNQKHRSFVIHRK